MKALLALLPLICWGKIDTAAIIWDWPVYQTIDYNWGSETEVDWHSKAQSALETLAWFAGFKTDSTETLEYYLLIEAPCYIYEGWNAEPPYLPDWWCDRAIYEIAWQKIETLKQNYRRKHPFWWLEGSHSQLAYLLWQIQLP